MEKSSTISAGEYTERRLYERTQKGGILCALDQPSLGSLKCGGPRHPVHWHPRRLDRGPESTYAFGEGFLTGCARFNPHSETKVGFSGAFLNQRSRKKQEAGDFA